jgi:hypothetical protein
VTTREISAPEGERRFEERRHLPAPDYTRPLLDPSPAQRQRVKAILAQLYGEEGAEAQFPELLRLMRSYYAHKPPEMIDAERSLDAGARFDERDVALIT